MLGSCAIDIREPCQVRKKAALSGMINVPQGCLSGVTCIVTARKCPIEEGVRGFFFRAMNLFHSSFLLENTVSLY